MIKYIPAETMRFIFSGSKKHLLDSDDLESLRVLARISDEFYQFLCTQDHGVYPSFCVAEYAIGTIRSGLDSFFDVYLSTNHLKLHTTVSSFELTDFGAFYRTYDKHFSLLIAPGISVSAFLATTVVLWKLHFVFLCKVL